MKTAMITGASGGVGQALAGLLRGEGWRLALVGRDAAKIQSSGNDVVIQADVSQQVDAVRAVAEATEKFGAPPSALINAAGNSLIAPLSRTREEQYRACMAANVDTAFFSSQAYLAQLSEHKVPGSIVLFSSVVAGIGVSNHVAIAAAKGAIEAMVRSIAADFSAHGVRINAVAPGLMRSPMTARMLGNEMAEKQISAQYPLGTFGDARDGAAVAAWLLSDTARWITGQVIHLDGGFSAVRPYIKG
jgi:NAD(P)-dependent dehydrogenase (short-subunit alcohol dehydrogenase family)